MPSNKFAVIVAEQGKPYKTVMVGSGATVRSTLAAFGLNPDALAGSITLNGRSAQLADRVKKDDTINVTPKVAGGSR